MKTLALIFLIVGTILSALGGLFLKKSTKKNKKIPLIKNKMLFLGLICYFISSLLNIISLKYIEFYYLSITYLNQVWILFLGKKYLKEKITKTNIIAVILIITGSIILSIY